MDLHRGTRYGPDRCSFSGWDALEPVAAPTSRVSLVLDLSELDLLLVTTWLRGQRWLRSVRSLLEETLPCLWPLCLLPVFGMNLLGVGVHLIPEFHLPLVFLRPH